MRSLVIIGILGAGMAVSANDAFATKQVISPEGTVSELRTSVQNPDQSTRSPRTLYATASNDETRTHQRAVEINRKAARLLDTYQKRLGVRVNDIRHKVLSEGDLDLLLQVDAFVKAAAWYEQSSKPGTSPATPFDNFGRILLRSATRVEQAMEKAPQDRRFADTWSSIQANLADIEPDKSFLVR